MAKKLTARSVEQARPHSKKRIEIPDAGKPGLYLVIQPSGKKSWAVRYRYQGRPRKVTLNGFPSLAVAHKLAQAELDKATADAIQQLHNLVDRHAQSVKGRPDIKAVPNRNASQGGQP